MAPVAAAGTKVLVPCGIQEKEGSPLWAGCFLGHRTSGLKKIHNLKVLTFIWGKMRTAAWEQHLR